jgi:hypothetical protein
MEPVATGSQLYSRAYSYSDGSINLPTNSSGEGLGWTAVELHHAF